MHQANYKVDRLYCSFVHMAEGSKLYLTYLVCLQWFPVNLDLKGRLRKRRGELDACVVWDHPALIIALIQLCCEDWFKANIWAKIVKCYFYRIWKIIFISHCKFRFTETVTIRDVKTRKVWNVGGIWELVVIQDKVRVSSTKWKGTNSTLTQKIEATTTGYKDYG